MQNAARTALNCRTSRSLTCYRLFQTATSKLLAVHAASTIEVRSNWAFSSTPTCATHLKSTETCSPVCCCITGAKHNACQANPALRNPAATGNMCSRPQGRISMGRRTAQLQLQRCSMSLQLAYASCTCLPPRLGRHDDCSYGDRCPGALHSFIAFFQPPHNPCSPTRVPLTDQGLLVNTSAGHELCAQSCDPAGPAQGCPQTQSLQRRTAGPQAMCPSPLSAGAWSCNHPAPLS